MSIHGAYEDSNVFARILRGEIPNVTVHEDDDVLAFMDAFPQSRGHLLVISKTSKARNLLEVEADVLATLMAQVQRLARAVNSALRPDGIRLMQLNGAPAGQTVFHLHFHLMPIWTGQSLNLHAAAPGNVEELKVLARQIAAELG